MERVVVRFTQKEDRLMKLEKIINPLLNENSKFPAKAKTKTKVKTHLFLLLNIGTHLIQIFMKPCKELWNRQILTH